MIHRSFAAGLVCFAAMAVTLGWVEEAQACLTTTCAVKNPPVACVRDPETYCWLAGIPLQWENQCVSFSVDQRGIPLLGLGYADTEALVVTSFALWTAATCPYGYPAISVMNAGPLECTKVEYNLEGPNANSVVFRTGSWPHKPQAIGITTVTFNPETGRILDADIEVNVGQGQLDIAGVRYVVAHEAGHFFGIDHSADPSALMFERGGNEDFNETLALTPDDVNAICLAYPTSRPAGPCDFEPARGYSPVCGGDIEGSCAVAGRIPQGAPATEAVLVAAALGSFLARSRTTRKRRPVAARA